MTNLTDAELIVEHYLSVWSEPDPELRRRAIASLWTADGVEFVDGAQFRGPQELDARIAEAYTEFVGSGKYAVTSAGDETSHQDLVTFTIQLTAEGEVAWAARVFLLLAADGRIREDYHLTVKPLAA